MVVKVRDDNAFQDVSLISRPIKIALNSEQIQLALIRNATSNPPSGMVSLVLLAFGCVYKRVFHQSCSEESALHQYASCGVPDTMPNVLLCMLVSEGDV